jgi:hypothetical protein
MTDKLNVLVLYDDHFTHIGTVGDHVESFKKYSRHNIFYLPGSLGYDDRPYPDTLTLDLFDVVILHYSVRLTISDYFQPVLAKSLERFSGLKILFLQDEYEATERTRRALDRLQFDVVYTCVPQTSRESIYPSARFPKTEFIQTLTGFVPEYAGVEDCAVPLEQRQLMLAYRGRILNPVYGELGREKTVIGTEMLRLSAERGWMVDIEVDDEKRIYGVDWYRFLGSARATLGTESGSNAFDFDGSLRTKIAQALAINPTADWEDLYRPIVAPHDGVIKMNQISPKIFEAIRLKTALVLFEGDYSGVVQPDRHYIPLKKDFSNSAEVFSKIENLDFIRELTTRAYNEIIQPGLYSYRHFVAGVDETIARKYKKPARFELFSMPLIVRDRKIMDQAEAWKLIAPFDSLGFALTTGVLSTQNISRYGVEKFMDAWIDKKYEARRKLEALSLEALTRATVKSALMELLTAISTLSDAVLLSAKYRIKHLLTRG